MTKHILLYEPKTAEGELLTENIKAIGDVQVTRVRTMREACAVLTTRPCDLALLPVTRNDSLVYSLRMLQPNLPMYLVLERVDEFVPERQAQVVRGQIMQDELLASLPTLLGFDELRLAEPTAQPTSETTSENETEKRTVPLKKLKADIDRQQLTMLVQNSMLDDRVLVIVVSNGDEVIGFRHAVHQGQIEAITQQLRRSWPLEATLTAQIQYLPASSEEHTAVLLYSRPLWDNFLLTIGGVPHMPLTQLRQHADRIHHALIGSEKEDRLQSQQHVESKATLKRTAPLVKNHAFVLRSQDPLNGEVILALQGILPTLGRDYGLNVHHIIIQPTFVHFMTSGSAQHTTAWLAQYFKTAIMEALETYLDLPWPFWTSGYYAEETDTPLNPAELTFFAHS